MNVESSDAHIDAEGVRPKIQPEPMLLEFVRYNHWANQQLLSVCIELDEGLISVDIPGTAGSIYETFAHLLRAETGFLKRIHGTRPQPAFNWDEHPSLAQMVPYATQLADAFIETIQHVSPTENVHEENEVWSFDYQARLIFMSHIYHAISHRTDITTFLNHQGVALPELDVWGYQEAYPDRFQAKLVKLTET